MKTDSQIMNELASGSIHLHSLTEDESRDLKRVLLRMYSDFASLCKKHGLVFMLGGGSCLGTIRHQGFIPWDDDLDVMMYRSDYEKLIRLCEEGAIGADYEFEAPGPNRDCKTPYLKLHRKKTVDMELIDECTPFPKGVFLDVFPMDSAPRRVFWQRTKGAISDLLQVICTCVLYAQYPSSKYLAFVSQNPEALKRYRIRMCIGRFFKFFPHKKWVQWFDRFNASDKKTGFITVATGRKHYFGEIQKEEVFFPVEWKPFEGMTVPVCHDWHTYLKTLYNDYMEIPPVEKRERHMVYRFECNVSN